MIDILEICAKHNVYLNTRQKEIIAEKFSHNEDQILNFFKKVSLLGKDSLTDAEFFSLTGYRDITSEMYSALIQNEFEKYITIFNLSIFEEFVKLLQYRFGTYEKYVYLNYYFDANNIMLEEATSPEITTLIKDFYQYEGEKINEMNVFLLREPNKDPYLYYIQIFKLLNAPC